MSGYSRYSSHRQRVYYVHIKHYQRHWHQHQYLSAQHIGNHVGLSGVFSSASSLTTFVGTLPIGCVLSGADFPPDPNFTLLFRIRAATWWLLCDIKKFTI